MAAPRETIYVLDTNILIDLRLFPERVFSRLWTRVEALAVAGRIVYPEEVRRELEPSEDEPLRWLKRHNRLEVASEVLWEAAAIVANRFPDLINLAKPKGTADPFVVGLAMLIEDQERSKIWGHEVVVVSQERSKRPSKTAVPDACSDLGIRCVKLIEWFELEGWTDL